jgi:hypothetical protein
MRFFKPREFALPIRCVRCPFCAGWVPVPVDAWTALETLWLHEYECSAIELVPANA